MSKTNKIKILAMFCALIFLCMPIQIYAESLPATNFYSHHSLVPNPPNDIISTRGALTPTSLWNIADAEYDFHGSSGGQPLYTNYYFGGKTSYTIHVRQGGNYNIKIQCISYSTGKVLKTENLGPDDISITFTLDTKETFYLKFHSPYLLIFEYPFEVESGSYVR